MFAIFRTDVIVEALRHKQKKTRKNLELGSNLRPCRVSTLCVSIISKQSTENNNWRLRKSILAHYQKLYRYKMLPNFIFKSVPTLQWKPGKHGNSADSDNSNFPANSKLSPISFGFDPTCQLF